MRFYLWFLRGVFTCGFYRFYLWAFTHVFVYLNPHHIVVLFSFYIMDFSRCVVVNASEYVWERILPYMMKKSERYQWITVTKDEPCKPNTDIIHTHITLHIWWDGNKDFSATPLRSHMKRVKQKIIKNDAKTEDVKECVQSFRVSRSTPTKHILLALNQSAKTYNLGGSNTTQELGEYLAMLMKKAKYTQVCINKFIQKVNPLPQSELTQPVDMPTIPPSVPSQSEPPDRVCARHHHPHHYNRVHRKYRREIRTKSF